MNINTLTYGSVCSGIEAVSIAWDHLPLTPLWFSEIAPFPCAVLTHHWSDIPNHGDMTLLADKMAKGDIPAPDVLVGGTPCQAFSVAGRRQGLADPRGQLTLAYIQLADAIDAKRKEENRHAAIILWENVPGVLSDTTNAFGHFLAGLAGTDCPFTPGLPPARKRSGAFWRWSKKCDHPVPKWPRAGCVYGARRTIAWRVMDAQYLGLGQRRKRLYVIASADKGFDPARILFEFDSLPGNSAPGCGTEPSVTTLSASGTDCSELPTIVYNRQRIGEYTPATVISTCNASDYKSAHDLALSPVICIAGNTIGRNLPAGGHGCGLSQELCYTLDTSHTAHAVATDYTVRSLMPIEYERLQGFPDNHTQIPWRGKPAQQCPDSPRYKALGNSMPVPVIKWIGERLHHYHFSR